MPRPGARVLVIDEDDERRRLCREILTVAGFDVDCLGPGTGDAARDPVAWDGAARDPAAHDTSGGDTAPIAVTTVDGLVLVDRYGIPADRRLVLTDDPAAHLGDRRAREWLATPLIPAALRRAITDLLDATGP